MIEIVGTELYQWDTGRSVMITGYEVEYAHFANKGDSKAVKIGVVDIDAKIPDYLLQTGKELCVYAVKDGITLESKTFSVKKRERPEDYVYEEDQRNFIYELIQSAEEATDAANIAAEAAEQATQEAANAAGIANDATKAANQAAQSAAAASEMANEAAIKATNAAKSCMVIGKAEGEIISLDDAIDQTLVGLRVFGKTTQNGTPTPDAPVDLVSVGDGGSITVDVNNTQSMTIATPNGLPGIPVTSGGNYTDGNGQQWICDEIDFGRGVYIQRIERARFNGDEAWSKSLNKGNNYLYHVSLDKTVGRTESICDRLIDATRTSKLEADGQSLENIGCFVSKAYNVLYVNLGYYMVSENTTAELSNILGRYPITVQYILATPIETPLSEEELAAYANLHTYRGNTTVSNDAGAWMGLEYVMDAKKYIDSLATGTLVPARVE